MSPVTVMFVIFCIISCIATIVSYTIKGKQSITPEYTGYLEEAEKALLDLSKDPESKVKPLEDGERILEKCLMGKGLSLFVTHKSIYISANCVFTRIPLENIKKIRGTRYNGYRSYYPDGCTSATIYTYSGEKHILYGGYPNFENCIANICRYGNLRL